MDERMHADTIGRGEVLALTQRSVRRRDYELRRGDQVLGWLRFPSGGRSTASAWGDRAGPLVLIASSGRVDVRGGPGAATIATVERERGGLAAIRPLQGNALGWRRTGRRYRWAIDDRDVAVLSFTYAHRRLKSSVRITIERATPEPTVVLLCLIGGFLALSGLQAEIDGSAAVAGIVATGAG
jgi:hypothetical protein